MKFKPGDLVKLKGFKKLDINDTPIGIIVAHLGLGKYKINWADTIVSKRFALSTVIKDTRLELLNEVGT